MGATDGLTGRCRDDQTMRFVLGSDAREFAGRVRPFLEARIECNVLATVLLGVLEGRYADPAPVLAQGVGDRGEVLGVALRTPPFAVTCSDLDSGAAAQLVEFWLAEDPKFPGVSSVSQSARAVSAAWELQTGGSARRQTAMARHSLTKVLDLPHPAGGRQVKSSDGQHDLLVAWWKPVAAMADMVDDIEWITPRNSAISGTTHGKQELGANWAQLAEKGFTTTTQHFFADEERVAVLAQDSVAGKPRTLRTSSPSTRTAR